MGSNYEILVDHSEQLLSEVENPNPDKENLKALATDIYIRLQNAPKSVQNSWFLTLDER